MDNPHRAGVAWPRVARDHAEISGAVEGTSALCFTFDPTVKEASRLLPRARTSECISSTSTIDVSSTTNRSHGSGLDSSLVKRLFSVKNKSQQRQQAVQNCPRFELKE
jgi:hypothetical protein